MGSEGCHGDASGMSLSPSDVELMINDHAAVSWNGADMHDAMQVLVRMTIKQLFRGL